MRVSTGHGTLRRARKELLARWSETKLAWRDENRAQFEAQFLKPLLARLRTAERAIAHMDSVLARIHEDCE